LPWRIHVLMYLTTCGQSSWRRLRRTRPVPYRDDDRQRAYKREWARIQRAGECGTPGGTLPLPFRLQTARDVVALLEEQIVAVRADAEARTLEKARTIGYLAGVALKAVETADLAGRLEALESVLKGRRRD
jgi:hypothetical protein